MLPTQLRDKTDIKIFVLHLLRNIAYPLEFYDINDIVLQDGLVGGIDFYECFSQLCQSGNIEETKEGDKTFYEITEQGKDVAATLSSELLPHIRSRSLKSALRYLSFKKRKANLATSTTLLDDGRTNLTCTIIQEGCQLLQLQLLTDSDEQANKMKAVFQDRPEHIYRHILALLSGEVDYLINK